MGNICLIMFQPYAIQYENGEQRLIGWFDKDKRVFRKEIDSRKHKMGIYNGYGFDNETLQKLAEADYQIEIHDTHTKKTHIISARDFYQSGIYDEFGKHKGQKFLDIKQFQAL